MKNMMLDTWDGKIFMPRFYDCDTICSYDNTGDIAFDVDIEMAQGYWNTSSSRLWTRVRDLFHDELIEVYKDMRGNGVTYEGIMYYMYNEQIGKIPQTYYNKDFDIKYAPYANTYIGKAHGDGYEHMKRWLKNRFIFCDTLFDYAPSYNNDVLTIRANTTDLMSITIETYIPLYQHVSYYNGQMSKEKVVPGQPITFEGYAQTATDQEVLIYGGSNIKKITGISSMNPNSMLIGGATRLTELDISNCPILTIVNSNKANFSPHTYLNKLNISNCPQLGGNLNVSNSPLLQEIDARGSAVTGLLLPTSLRNLEVLRLPNTIPDLTLHDVPLLHTIELDEGNALNSLSLSNCSKLDNCINFDLTKVPTISLDNSFDTEELYMSATTNLTLKNMPSLKRVIFTPNSEYSAFDINNVLNGASYKITTFNNPMMTDFITTAPHRLSYGGEDVEYIEEVITQGGKAGDTYELLDGYVMSGYWDGSGTYFDSTTYYQFAVLLPSKGYTSLDITYLANSSGNIRVTQFNEDVFIAREVISDVNAKTRSVTISADCNKVIFVCDADRLTSCTCVLTNDVEEERIAYKDYGDITPNTAFTANTLDLADTQFQNVKFLCTTDIYNLKVPTTMKNFYCDSAFDIDTDVIEDASYEVIHEELIEPYTTNYEGKVYYEAELQELSIALTNQGCFNSASDSFQSTTAGWHSDYIDISASDTVKVVMTGYDSNNKLRINVYNENKVFVTQILDIWDSYMSASTNLQNVFDVSDYYYLRISHSKTTAGTPILTLEQPTTPNLIPSSANGSLIFNMYSNNTTQPTSTSPYMWDLTGLKLNDFYTYGMNNWVKASDDSYVTIIEPNFTYIERGIYWYHDFCGGFGSGNQRRLPPILFRDVEGIEISANDGTTITVQIHKEDKSPSNVQGGGRYQGSLVTESAYSSTNTWGISGNKWVCISFECLETTEYIDIDIGIEKYRYYITDICRNATTGINTEVMKTHCIDINDISSHVMYYGNPTSITMPQRMPGYSVRLVNADITPDEYPTMLYPKLIDITLPITGKLDYTKYNGTSLAWAYAYTTDDVDINPLGSREQVNITNDYNKLYSTDFVDIIDVWVYKDTDVSKLSTNENIKKAYIELTKDNYTTRVDEVLQWYPNCTDLYLFEDGSVTNLKNSNSSYLGHQQIVNIVFIDGYFENLTDMTNAFRNCKLLESVNRIPPNVTELYCAFYNCFKITNIPELPKVARLRGLLYNCKVFNQELDLSSCSITSTDGLQDTFYGCSSLTTPPILPSNYTGTMQSCFQGCSSLTTTPVIPEGVTNMYGCFQSCTSLTTVLNIPNSCISFGQAFDNCQSLVTVPSDWQGDMNMTFKNCPKLNCQINISSATNLSSTFQNCQSLTIPPVLSNVSNCSMQSCFHSCKSLTEAPVIPEGVTNMNSCFEGCTSLVEAPYISENVTQADALYRNCTSLTKAVLPIGNANCYLSLAGANNVTDIIFVGLRTTDYNMSWITDRFDSSIICSNIQELVPEHLADLHKDKAIFDFSNKKITINNTETTWEEE